MSASRKSTNFATLETVMQQPKPQSSHCETEKLFVCFILNNSSPKSTQLGKRRTFRTPEVCSLKEIDQLFQKFYATRCNEEHS